MLLRSPAVRMRGEAAWVLLGTARRRVVVGADHRVVIIRDGYRASRRVSLSRRVSR
jgi:hypothetical protein